MMLLVVRDEVVNWRGMSLEVFACLLATWFVEIIGLHLCKGAIVVGVDVDFVIWDFDVVWCVDVVEFFSWYCWTLLEGCEICGCVV